MRARSIGLLLSLVLPEVALAQSRLVACPASHRFGQTLAVAIATPEYMHVFAGVPRGYTPEFVYGAGSRPIQYAGQFVAQYKFAPVVSTDSWALLSNGYINATCSEIPLVNAPGDTTWVSYIANNGHGGETSWNISLEEEETCEAETMRAEDSNNANSVMNSSAHLESECDGSGGGDDGGGGETRITRYCLWMDYYSAEGVYRYSVLVGCWEEET